jgi:hypothetical protein
MSDDLKQQDWKIIMLAGLKSELALALFKKRFPTFINNTNLSVNIETWQIHRLGIDESISKLVLPGKKIRLISSTGEWLLNTYLFDKKLCDEWTSAGYTVGNTVGKFRNSPCARGNYSWMYEKGLDIIYDPLKRTATFIKK